MHKLFLFALTFAGFAQAALPPYYERLRQLDAILKEKRVETAVQDPRFAGKSSKVVDGVRYLGVTPDRSLYEVTTGKCKLDVSLKTVALVNDQGHPIVGPGKIVLYVGNSLRCP